MNVVVQIGQLLGRKNIVKKKKKRPRTNAESMKYQVSTEQIPARLMFTFMEKLQQSLAICVIKL